MAGLNQPNRQILLLNMASRLDLFTAIGKETSTAKEIAKGAGLDDTALARLLDALVAMLLGIVNIGSIRHQDVVISNIRHYNALKSASESLARVSEGLASALPSDLLAQDIREVLHYLGEITGEVTTDEILGNIFRNFCIGK